MKNIYPLLLLVPALIFVGCSEDDDGSPTVPSGLIYSYYPINVGHELIYDVELITKDDFSGVEDTMIFQLKEVVESTFHDIQGRPTQRIERYTRPTSNDPWSPQPVDVWTSNRTESWVEKKEENIPFVKLVFPINPSITWNGNVLNTIDDQTYRYQDLHQPISLGSMHFDSTLKVLQIDEGSFIDTTYAEEKYANGVGLIYKQEIYVENDWSNPVQVGIKSQRRYKQTLVSFTN
jgi:hypothetical protein